MKLRNLPIGARISFGHFGFEEDNIYPLYWRYVDHRGVLLSSEVIFRMEYNTFMGTREFEPNNTYEASVIRMFLNSRADNWWHQRSINEVPPALYCKRVPGFLSHFTQDELGMLLPCEEGSHDYVSIPSVDQVFPSEINDRTFDYCRSGSSWCRLAGASDVMFENEHYIGGVDDFAEGYWLKSDEVNDAGVWVNPDGYLSSEPEFFARHGVRPYIKIDLDTEVVGPSVGGIYNIIPARRRPTVSNDELLAILNL